MLTRIRDSSKSLAFYVLGGLVVAMLIISFGTPPVGGGMDGALTAATALEVMGQELSAEDYRQAFLLAQGNRFSTEQARAFRVKESVMDRLIERELLAAEAARLGIATDTAQVEDQIAQARLTLFGREQLMTDLQEDGVFSYERFRRFLQFYGMNERSFMNLQARELKAERVRRILSGGVTVSPDEVRERFEREGHQVNLEYVRVAIRKFEDELEPSAEEVAAFATKQEADIKAQYEQRKFLFEGVPRERKLRQILVELPEGAGESERAAARSEAERLGRLVRAARDGQEAFVKVRADLAAAARAPGRAGKGRPRVELRRLGWRRQGATSLEPDLEAKVLAAEDGTWVGPEATAEGFSLIRVEGTREGDLTLDAVKLELAEELLRKEQARERARAEAERLLADARAQQARAPGRTLAEVFPAPKEKPVVGEGPVVEETGLFARRGAVVEGIGLSPELARAAFALTPEAPLAGPFEVAGNFVLVRLKERVVPDLAEFERTRSDLVAAATERKGREVVAEWVLARCKQARDAGRLSVNKQVLVYDDGKAGSVPYEPCSPAPFGL